MSWDSIWWQIILSSQLYGKPHHENFVLNIPCNALESGICICIPMMILDCLFWHSRSVGKWDLYMFDEACRFVEIKTVANVA